MVLLRNFQPFFSTVTIVNTLLTPNKLFQNAEPARACRLQMGSRITAWKGVLRYEACLARMLGKTLLIR
jgi:hypothetical protein